MRRMAGKTRTKGTTRTAGTTPTAGTTRTKGTTPTGGTIPMRFVEVLGRPCLTIPVVFWSAEVQDWLGYLAPEFPGSADPGGAGHRHLPVRREGFPRGRAAS